MTMTAASPPFPGVSCAHHLSKSGLEAPPAEDVLAAEPVPPPVLDLYLTMAESSLAAPPVPRRFRDRIRNQGRLQWGTEPFDAREHYYFRGYWRNLLQRDDDTPLYTFGFGGYGINSYCFTLTVRLGPVLVAAQSHWNPTFVYSVPPRNAGLLARQFILVRLLLTAIDSRPGPTWWVVLSSQLRSIHQLVSASGVGAPGAGGSPWRQHDPPHQPEWSYADDEGLFRATAERLGVTLWA